MTPIELLHSIKLTGGVAAAREDSVLSPILKYVDTREANGLIHLRYTRFDQIFNEVDHHNFWDSYGGLFRDLRSCVLDYETEEYVIRPFKKFFNINELPETSYDEVVKRMASAGYIEISNKLDGSMVSASAHNGGVVVATAQALDPTRSWRLEDAANKIKGSANFTGMILDNPGNTYVFEYIDPRDTHLVVYGEKDYGLHLIGIVDNKTGYEHPYSDVLGTAEKYGIPTTEVYDRSFEDVWTHLGEKSCHEAEGFVINIGGWRVKLKYDDYVTMNKSIRALKSPKATIHAIADDRFDDLWAKVPDGYKQVVRNYYDKLTGYMDRMSEDVAAWYDKVKDLDIKTAMLKINGECPRLLRGYVVNAYKGREVERTDFLKKNITGYKKWNEIFPNEQIDEEEEE